MALGSFEQWYERSHARLITSLVLATGDADLAQEAVDEACLRALMRWDRVAVMGSPDGWTYRVALNVARRHRRRSALEARILARRPPQRVVPPPAEEAWQAVRCLPPRQRVAVVLRYVGDLTKADVGLAMGVSRSTVSSTLMDARRALGSLLSDDADEQEGLHA